MIHGVINIYKEKGFTSHDVVAKLRGILKQKKIGHTGTLDPDAEGVLQVCLGKATKLCDMLTDKDKTYETVLLLGQVTDTQDISGQILEEHSTGHLTEEMVREAILSFAGEYDQIPPMYSALKVNGKKLYELAREGKEVERKPRKVTIYQIVIKEINLPRVRMEVKCSKGTYIRTLCHDIGMKLKCGGCMESLLRTQVERFSIEDSRKLSDVENHFKEQTLDEIIIPIDKMFENLKAVTLTAEAARAVCNGNGFQKKGINAAISNSTENAEFIDAERVRVYGEDGSFIAIYEYRQKTDDFKIVRMFFDGREQ